jgi:hypothetical protein
MFHKVPSIVALQLKRYKGYGDSDHQHYCVRSCVGGLLQIHEQEKDEEHDKDYT